jgi:hypothetical protein
VPHQTLKLIPGVDTTKTPTLNEAGISESQLIRFAIDRAGIGLVQKLGGWTRFYPTAMPSTVRALCAWQDTDNYKWLAVGCDESATPGVGSSLAVISDGILSNITPEVRQDNVTVDFSTTAGSDIVDILDTGSNATAFDAVYIPTHVSVGGAVIFGFYQCIAASANVFQIQLTDTLGNPVYVPSTIANLGAVAVFDTTSGSATVEVTLNDHGYQVGDTYPILVSTVVGGLTLFGNNVVTEVTSANVFSFLANQLASATDTESINGGDVRLNFYLGAGALPIGSGYGTGGYGTGGYGSGATPTPSDGDAIVTLDWTLDNFGETLIACPVLTTFGSVSGGDTHVGGPLYYWSPQRQAGSPAPIAQGPICNDGAFVAMPQRQVIAWASSFSGIQDHLLIRWCDVGNFFNWVADPTTRAGSYRIPRGSRIISALQMGQQCVILTDVGVWTMQYTGGQGVYSFNEVGIGTGLLARKAVAAYMGSLYWMGPTQFYRMAGQGVESLSCPVWDIVFQNLDLDNVRKIRVAVNSRFNEITWYYPSSAGNGEVDSYVKLNTLLPDGAGWDYGSLGRTAWINQSILGAPIGAGTDSVLYQHETSNDADGQALVSSFTTGYFALNEADMLMFVDQVWPDMKWGSYGSSPNAQVLMTFYVAEYPNGPVSTYGPYTLSNAIQYVSPRFRGRLVSIKFESVDVGTFWRLGAMRYRAAPDGKFL